MTQNLTAIATVAAGECIRQHVGLDRLVTLLDAYDNFSLHTRQSFLEEGVEAILMLAGQVEPDNGGRMRTTPVTFLQGGTAAPAQQVPSTLNSLVEHAEHYTTEEWMKEFLWIHPFTDGNGRTAWVIWNIFNGTMDNPTTLPKFFDGE